MPDDLYERDILEWPERQANLLRRVANGERTLDEMLTADLETLFAAIPSTSDPA
jgi:hypothetical protein